MGWLAGVASILLTQVVWLAAFAGIGVVLARRVGRESKEVEDVIANAWFGFAAVLLALLVWHLFLPIDWHPAGIVLGLGACGIWRARAALFRALHTRPRPIGPALPLMGVGLAIWQANLSMDALDSWDSSLYHIQGVLWSETHAAVPGLANLYGPLGFNNTSFLYDALLSTGPWSGRSEHIANGALMLLGLIQAIVGAARIRVGSPGPTSAFDLTMLIPILALAVEPRGLASFETHLPATLCLLAATSQSLRLVTTRIADPFEARAIAAIAFGLLGASVAIKASTAVFVAAWAMVFVLQAAHKWRWAIFDVLRPAMLIAALFAIAWGAHGVVLSGYPAFPSTLVRFPVDWAAPLAHAEAEWAYAGFSEREFEWEIGAKWLRLFGTNAHVGWLACIVGASAWMAAARRRRGTTSPLWSPWTPLLFSIPSVIAIGVWLHIAPALRYAVAFFWVPAGLAVTEYVSSSTTQKELSRLLVILGCTGLSGPLVIPIQRGRTPSDVLRANLTTPGPDRFLHPRPDQASFAPYITRSNLIVNVPTQERCWDIPLPCTPNPAPNLRARDPADLSRGFSVGAEWEMENFPHSWQQRFRNEWPSRPEGRSLPRPR